MATTEEPAELGEEDIFRIMISTDNHLGFMERDHLRRHDSFLAFEEVLSLARDRDVSYSRTGGRLCIME